MTILKKATEQYIWLPVVLFILLYKSHSITFEFVDEILKCDLSNESYCSFLSVVLFVLEILAHPCNLSDQDTNE